MAVSYERGTPVKVLKDCGFEMRVLGIPSPEGSEPVFMGCIPQVMGSNLTLGGYRGYSKVMTHTGPRKVLCSWV